MKRPAHPKRRGRIMLWSLLVIFLGAMIAPLGGYLYVGLAQAQTTEESAAAEPATDWEQTNPRSDYWREVREGQSGYSTLPRADGNDLIQNGGENWRQLRNGPVMIIGGLFLPLVVLAIGLFHLWKGQKKVQGPLSGRRVQRWTRGERILHWTTASLFILLAITGLSLLFGRVVLIPLMGHEGFAAWALAAKWLHNLGGPLFSVCVLLIVLFWIKDNIPNRTDLEWFRNGGGMFGKHASAGRMNGGEKVWFWFIATFGVIVCITGLILDFPNVFTGRDSFQNANLIHAALAIAWVGLFFGHAYIGTLGTEGALEGMTTGQVSEEWARQHHDLWLEEMQQGGGSHPAAERPAGSSAPKTV
ncbi:MAG: formate dehydrogenase subunit gamma [Gammaproteobacteria bacterium]